MTCRALLYTLLSSALFCIGASAQPELSTGIVGNKRDAIGPAFHFAYDLKVKDRFYAKPQAGYKYLYNYENFVGAKLKVFIYEVHQTFSYEFKFKPKYTFKPNVGVNYRWYRWRAEMVPPLNTRPIRGYSVYFRDGSMRVESVDGKAKNTYRIHNLGFSLQLQNQYKLNERLWFHITLFMEPDYDRSQNTGGCYLGFILKNRPKQIN